MNMCSLLWAKLDYHQELVPFTFNLKSIELIKPCKGVR
jgi:hypothetical protein